MKEYRIKCYEGNHPRINVTEEFVTKNNLTLTRTQEEIVERTQEESKKMLGFQVEVLTEYLDWDHAKQFYKEEYVKEVEAGTKEKPQPVTDLYEATQDMLDYLVFGYMKALDERGISASRTIDKLSAWLWLLGRDDLRRLISDDELYNPYGMPALIELTKALGLPVPEDCIAFAEHKV